MANRSTLVLLACLTRCCSFRINASADVLLQAIVVNTPKCASGSLQKMFWDLMPCDKEEKELGPNHVLKSYPGTGSFVYRSHDVNESVKYFEEHPNLKLGGANGRSVAGKQYLRDHGIQLRSWIHPICVGSLSLCSSTPVIVSMEECAFASAAYLLRSSPRDVHGTEQRWKLSLTARTYRVSANGGSRSRLNLFMGPSYWRMGVTVEPSLRTRAASRRCSWGSPETRRP